MTQGQANLLGGVVVGAFFTAASAGLVGLVMEMEGRDVSVRGEQRRKRSDSEIREQHPPGFLEIGLMFLGGAAAGAALGACAAAIAAPFRNRQGESRIIDITGALFGALLGACVGLILTQGAFLRRDDPWGRSLVAFGVVAGAVIGAWGGGLFGAGVRGWVMKRVENHRIGSLQ